MGDQCERAHHNIKLPHRDPKSPPLFRSPSRENHSSNPVVTIRSDNLPHNSIPNSAQSNAHLHGQHHSRKAIIIPTRNVDAQTQPPTNGFLTQRISSCYAPVKSTPLTEEPSSTATKPRLNSRSPSPATEQLVVNQFCSGNANFSGRIFDYLVTHQSANKKPIGSRHRDSPPSSVKASAASGRTWLSNAIWFSHRKQKRRNGEASGGCNYNVVKQSVFLYAIASVALAVCCMSSTVVAHNDAPPTHQM